jgi:hypothetical protein
MPSARLPYFPVYPLTGTSCYPIHWLWPGRLAFGNLTLLDADPGAGASLLALDIAARTSAGAEMPGGGPASEAADVLLLCSGDPLTNVIRPRLQAAGADFTRIHHGNSICFPGDDVGRPLTLPADLRLLDEVIRTRRIRLLVIDPLLAFLGPAARPSSDHAMCRLLDWVADLAQRTACAMLLVRNLAHTDRRQGPPRGVGSVGLDSRPRIGLVLAEDPHSPGHRVLVCRKNSLGPLADSLRFRIEPTQDSCRIIWSGPSPTSPADLLAAEEFGALAEARAWLESLLADEPQPATVCLARARSAGISARTLRRAKARLGVRSVRCAGPAPEWFWELPPRPG